MCWKACKYAVHLSFEKMHFFGFVRKKRNWSFLKRLEAAGRQEDHSGKQEERMLLFYSAFEMDWKSGKKIS